MNSVREVGDSLELVAALEGVEVRSIGFDSRVVRGCLLSAITAEIVKNCLG